ncbi:MAG: hypothetical protein LBC02_05465, partial [Planctomycetaceae bacterium]|nr:hypothetical protein [Planctomycetaceae bacterium]
MSDRFLADSFYYAHRLQQLEDENLDLRKKIEDLESTNQDLESSNDSHLRQVHDLELEIERLTSLNHELSSTLEHDASATASRPPSFFSQLCWAHFLRKSAELMLRNPTNSSYRQFYIRLLLLYRLAKRYQKDQRLSVGRAAKVQELQQKVLKLCKRYGEEIMTESKSEK